MDADDRRDNSDEFTFIVPGSLLRAIATQTEVRPRARTRDELRERVRQIELINRVETLFE